MKLNRKGFTLIELLATIVIIALVVGLSTYGIISAVNNSKEKASAISISSIKEAASIYSSEASSDLWKHTDKYDAFCVTVGELMNKGLLDKNAKIEGEIDKNTFIIVKKNKITLAVEKEEIVSDNIDDENNQICTNQFLEGKEDYTSPKVKNHVSFTDRIEISFTPGSATYNGSDSTVTYTCLYGETSSSINKEGTIEGNKCILSNLKSDHEYYAIIYMNTNHGSSIAAVGEREYKTANFKKTRISQNKNTVTIKYEDKDSNGNTINPVYHYFQSEISGTSNKNVETCEYKNNIFTCSGNTTTISKYVWYKVAGTSVKITYPEANTDGKITASIYDGSNNSADSEKTISIRKYTIRFYKNNASKIDESTNSYIEKYCVTEGSNTCKITSPTITAPTGYSAVGWDTSSGSITASWSAGAEKSINADANYYAIIKANSYTVTYNGNGGTYNSSSTWVDYHKGTYGSTYTTYSNSNFFVRDGYTFTGWNEKADGTGVDWTAYINKPWTWTYTKDVTLYAQWKLAVTAINKNAYTCIDYGDSSYGYDRLAVYYITTCSNGKCNYTTKNGLNNGYTFSLELEVGGIPTWTIDQNSGYSYNVSDYSAYCGDWQYYINSESSMEPCYSGASTSTSTVVSFSKCTYLDNLYRTTTKVNKSGDNWYYNAANNCYMNGANLGENTCTNPGNGAGTGSVGFCGSCSSNADCASGMTCTGTCTGSNGKYKCCALQSGNSTITCN